jgi:ferredoxin-type protein NapH
MIGKIYTFLIVAGFLVFLAIPFSSFHLLTPNTVYEVIEDSERASLIENELRSYMGEEVSNLPLQSQLNHAFEVANQSILAKYSLTEEQISDIAGLMVANRLNQNTIDSLFSKPELEFQKTSFNNYGNWLYDKAYATEEASLQILEKVREDINNYEIIPKLGFDRYQKKNLKYSIARSSLTGPSVTNPWTVMFLSFGLIIIGTLGLSLQKLNEPPGIKNNDVFNHPATSRKWLGAIIGIFLIGFYIVLYFYPEFMTSWVAVVDPVSYLIKGSEAGHFFLYGFIYTISVLVMGVRMIIKYRHSRYQIVRTISVMFFQTVLAFLLPEILVRLNQPYFDFKNIWPLDYDFFFDFELNKLIASGQIGIFMLVWGITLALIGVPLFTYFYGKRWYCSWVCGCGGLAETLGDPFRQLSDKSLKAWKFEQVSIYGVLVFAVIMTIGVLYTYFTGASQVLGINTFSMREVYGAVIGAGFAGVIGTGFYPFMGNRVWCRFGCPLAGYMGIIQRIKSRFRITTNGGQCISCGNCSTYCEMGIDVRSYAQKGENIIRASCVGCGVCAAVCPRGVLKLENGPSENRFEPNGFIK